MDLEEALELWEALKLWQAVYGDDPATVMRMLTEPEPTNGLLLEELLDPGALAYFEKVKNSGRP